MVIKYPCELISSGPRFPLGVSVVRSPRNKVRVFRFVFLHYGSFPTSFLVFLRNPHLRSRVHCSGQKPRPLTRKLDADAGRRSRPGGETSTARLSFKPRLETSLTSYIGWQVWSDSRYTCAARSPPHRSSRQVRQRSNKVSRLPCSQSSAQDVRADRNKSARPVSPLERLHITVSTTLYFRACSYLARCSVLLKLAISTGWDV